MQLPPSPAATPPAACASTLQSACLLYTSYLVQHAAEAQYLSISSLARECQVAEATVFRFCRSLGFEGYHEMRIALAQANATGVLVNQQAPSPDADTTTLCEHASALFMTAINGTQNEMCIRDSNSRCGSGLCGRLLLMVPL